MNDLWVQTQAGLVRADQVVHVTVRNDELRVSLLIAIGGGGIGDLGWNLEPAAFTVCRVGRDGKATARGLAAYLAACRAEGRRGIVGVAPGGEFTFDPFE